MKSLKPFLVHFENEPKKSRENSKTKKLERDKP